MNIKSIITGLLQLFDPLELIPILLNFLEEQARKTDTPVDDAIIAAMKAAAMKIWPDLF